MLLLDQVVQFESKRTEGAQATAETGDEQHGVAMRTRLVGIDHILGQCILLREVPKQQAPQKACGERCSHIHAQRGHPRPGMQSIAKPVRRHAQGGASSAASEGERQRDPQRRFGGVHDNPPAVSMKPSAVLAPHATMLPTAYAALNPRLPRFHNSRHSTA